MDQEERKSTGAAQSDEQVVSTILALEDEKRGYEARIRAAKTEQDDVAAEKYKGRIDQVDEQIDLHEDGLSEFGRRQVEIARKARSNAGGVETADDPKPKRAARAGGAK